jgi:DNA-binding transcriptional regulator LsrR (DeoR family)
MRINRAILEDYERLMEIVRVARLYSGGKKEVDIAAGLDISKPKVAKIVRERAIESGIMRIEVYPPLDEDMAERVQDSYGLKEVRVYPIGIEEEITRILARMSAIYLENLLRVDRRARYIAIGPGRTTLALVQSLSDEKRPDIVIGPTTMPSNVETYMAANIIIGIPVGKWGCRLQRPETEESDRITIEEQRRHASLFDVFILGIGNVMDNQGVTAEALRSKAIGISESALEKVLARLQGNGAVGFINYQPINGEGKALDWDLPGYKKVLEPTALRLEVIKEIASDKQKRVICIAGGSGKLQAIKAGLKGGYFNVLITDWETASALVR